ncbi:hypothetical protein CCAND38_150019 [Capnocytophaga canis]|uniref:Uncharacterized protein n=1 Tax=Capnocytophaga canis TaxID=1848903 RepID=A0A0B7HZG6_9FLAO|nr:hypothetical protein CCAND38_150019 [Capnocytophaga canis]
MTCFWLSFRKIGLIWNFAISIRFFMAQNTITTKGALIINDKQKRLHYNEN